MARILTEKDIKPALKLATSSTKKLVIAGVNGDEDFPKLLADYTWTGTRDYNMALIIIAFYAYCTKSEAPDLKKFGLSALRVGSSSDKMFEALREGNGKKIKYHMGSYFQAALDAVLKEALPDDEGKRAKIIKSFINQAGKITPWRINKKDVSNILYELIGKISKIKKYDEKLKELKEERDDELENIKPTKPDTREIKQALKSQSHHAKLIKERYDELEKVKSDFTINKEAAKNAANTVPLKRQLESALLRGHETTVRQIIESNPSIVNMPINQFRKTPLHIVAGSILDHRAIVELLMNHGADPNARDNKGRTPLDCAVLSINKREIIALLLDRDADPNVRDNRGETSLYHAMISSNTIDNKREIIALLLDHGADPNIMVRGVNTPLHRAAAGGYEGIVNLLLTHGADPNVRDDDHGLTPLSIAIVRGRRDIVELLLNHNADPNVQTRDGYTSLHIAAVMDNIGGDIITLLLDHGADPSVRNNDGDTYRDLLPRPQSDPWTNMYNRPPLIVANFPQDEFRRSLANGETKDCSICLDEFGANDLCCIFDCGHSEDYPFGHYLCNKCAQRLLTVDGGAAKCPTCRARLKPHN